MKTNKTIFFRVTALLVFLFSFVLFYLPVNAESEGLGCLPRKKTIYDPTTHKPKVVWYCPPNPCKCIYDCGDEAHTEVEIDGVCEKDEDASLGGFYTSCRCDCGTEEEIADILDQECPGICGDGAIDTGEVCDPPGEIAQCPDNKICAEDCKSCEEPPPVCGNNILESGETCDPPGEKAQCPEGKICAGDCKSCKDPPPVCGNNIPEPGEACDPPGEQAQCPANHKCADDCKSCIKLPKCGLDEDGQCNDGTCPPGSQTYNNVCGWYKPNPSVDYWLCGCHKELRGKNPSITTPTRQPAEPSQKPHKKKHKKKHSSLEHPVKNWQPKEWSKTKL